MAVELLQRYVDQQAAIASLLDRIEPLIGGDVAPDTAVLGRLRWELTRTLLGYQMFKHREIFDRANRTAADRTLAADLKTECIAIGEEYRQHVVRWTAGGTPGRWPEHRDAAQRMVKRLRAHMRRERLRVETLLDAMARPPAA